MKKITYTLILASAVLFSSCSDSWLDLNPTKSITPKQTFSTEDSFNAAVVGLYYSLQDKNAFGIKAIQAADLRGEDMILKQRNNYGWYSGIYTYSYSPLRSDGNDIYFSLYAAIEGCNSVLDADKMGEVSLPDESKNPLLAETKVIRALSYFELVRFFCLPYAKDNGASPGVPLKVESDVNVLQGRGTVKQVYDLILSDLNFAVKYLKPSDKKDRISLPYAQGLLARVYMTMGNYDEAVKYAKLAISNVAPLSPDFYSNGVSQDNSSVIFAIDYTKNTYLGYASYSSFNDFGWQDSSGYGSIGATEDFYKKYSKNDLRQAWFVNTWVYNNKLPYKSISKWTDIESNLKAGDKDFYDLLSGKYGLIPKGLWDDKTNTMPEENLNKLRTTMFDAGGFYKTVSLYGKFPRVDAIRAVGNNQTINEGTANLGNVPMMRIPELYLIVAEGSALKGDYATAKQYLTQVQANAHADVFNGSNNDLLDAIRLERRKELIGEGFRIFDIIRDQKVIQRPNYWGPAENATIDPRVDNSKVYLPIPQRTIDANPNLTNADQNAAYR